MSRHDQLIIIKRCEINETDAIESDTRLSGADLRGLGGSSPPPLDPVSRADFASFADL